MFNLFKKKITQWYKNSKKKYIYCNKCNDYRINYFTHCNKCNNCHTILNNSFCEKCEKCTSIINYHCNECNMCSLLNHSNFYCNICKMCKFTNNQYRLNDYSNDYLNDNNYFNYIIHCRLCNSCHDYENILCKKCHTCHKKDYEYCIICKKCFKDLRSHSKIYCKKNKSNTI